MLTTQKLHKILRTARHERSKWLASGRVRGWGNSTEGYELKKIEKNERWASRGRRWVRVGVDVTGFTLTHVAGSWNHLRGEEYEAHVLAKLAAYEEALKEAGIAFERKGREIHIPAIVTAPAVPLN